MDYEIDFLPVGEGEKSGDAIAVCFGNLTADHTNRKVFVIDGGTKKSGEDIINHIHNQYGGNHVDAVISTHPDSDHASGLTVVLESMDVDNLIMHRPWNYAGVIKDAFERRQTVFGLAAKMREELEMARELETIATRKGIKIHEPFSGLNGYDGALMVLGPKQEYYSNLLPHFRSTPEVKEELSLFQKIAQPTKEAKEAIEWLAETMDIETLDDEGGHFSAENSSSAIVLLSFGTDKILLTGDGDIVALTAAADYAQSQGIDLSALRLFQVPHHGSRHNIGPTILNRIKSKHSIVSAGPEGEPKHPAKKVTNALFRRGSQLCATQGKIVCFHSSSILPRKGWTSAPLIPFYNSVEK